MDNYGFVKVAAAVPHVTVADCARNAERIVALAQQAARRGVEIVAFPELAVTGYTCADLFLQPTLLEAADEALGDILRLQLEDNMQAWELRGDGMYVRLQPENEQAGVNSQERLLG